MNGWDIATKYPNLVNLLTTIIVSFSPNFRRPSLKSIVTFLQAYSRIFKGCKTQYMHPYLGLLAYRCHIFQQLA